MEISAEATASAAEQGATIYVALELSKSRWLVGIHTPLADKVSRYSVPGGDSAALLDRIGRARQRAEQRLERPTRRIMDFCWGLKNLGSYTCKRDHC